MRRVGAAQGELLRGSVVPDARVGKDDAPFPSRPAIPPVLAFALGLWAGCVAALLCARLLSIAVCIALCVGGIATCLCCLYLLWHRRRHLLALVLMAGLLCGGVLGFAQGIRLHQAQQAALESQGQMHITALSDGVKGEFGVSCTAHVRVEGTGRSFTAKVAFPREFKLPFYGERFAGYGSISELSQDRASWGWQRGIAANVTLRTCENVTLQSPGAALLSFRERAVRALIEPLRGDSGLAAAIACGWRADLPESVYRQFQVSGLAHVVAVSGAHLSIVAALVASILGALRFPKPISIAVQIALLAAYLALTAMPASAIRATLMTLAGMTSWTARRRASSLSALGCCIAVMLALDAQAALSSSFALSVLATLGIVVFGGLINSWLKACMGWLPAFVREALALTFASSVLATPFSAALFSQLPLAAPLANIATAPLFGPVCAAGIIGAVACASLPSPDIVASLACGSTSLLLKVVQACASIPYASIPVVGPSSVALLAGFAAACVLWLWWPKPDSRSVYRLLTVTGLMVALVFTLLKLPIAYGGSEIVALDVGQGDAILIRSGGRSVLVDTGNQDALLRQALARHRITRLDALVVTHPDDDHMGSLASLQGVVRVDRLLLARDGLACSCESCGKLRREAESLVGKERVAGLSQGDKLRLGDFEFTCVWPVAFKDEGGNGDSLCFTVDTDFNRDGSREWRSLLVGDAEHEEVAEMLSAGLIEGVDVYKVGHHGSKNALTQDQAAKLSPRVSLCSVGARNRYGHPAASTVEALERAGSAVVRTDEHGDVACRFAKDHISVKTLR